LDFIQGRFFSLTMKKWQIGIVVGGCILASIVFVLVLGIGWTVGTYNDLVNQEESIDGSWAQVENQYQRKVDLIPTLVATVEGYQEFEAGTLANITRLRTQWMEADTPEEQIETAGELDTALRSVILTYEAYPNLQSISAVRDLIVELEGTENRITTARMRYNEDVKEFNANIRTFPTVLRANSFGFEKREYFESDSAPNQPGM